MLTYQLQTRVLKLDNDAMLTFPNLAVIELQLSPSAAFGVGGLPSRTAVRAHKASLLMNANTGAWTIQSDPPLERLELTLETQTQKLQLSGDLLRLEFPCADAEELINILMGLNWMLPPLLNLDFADPPSVLWTRGTLGETKFRWELHPAEWQIEIWPKTSSELEGAVIKSFDRIGLFSGTNNRRLAAALHYFYKGVRLSVAGDSPWEFMAESILNYSKTLEILFRTSTKWKDDVRRELDRIGYTEEEIEGDFIPIIELRRVDVAHPKVSLYTKSDLQVLYKYIHNLEKIIRQLLNRLLEMVDNGSYQFPNEDISLSSEDRRHMERLVAQMKKRNGLTP